MTDSKNWYVKYTFALAAVMLTVYAMITAKSILVPFLFAIFLSILLTPVANWMEKYRLPRVVSSLFAIILGVLVIFGVGFFFYTQMTAFVNDADTLTLRLEELLTSLDGFLSSWFSIEGEINLERVGLELLDYVQANITSLSRGLSSAASVITNVFLVPVFIFLILLFRSQLKNFVMMSFGGDSDTTNRRVKVIIIKIRVLIQSYITGVLIVIVILSFLNSIMLSIIGVDHAIFFGVFAAMLNIIPFVGPLLGSILPIVYALITMDSLIYPLIIMIGFYVIQLFEGNLFTPTIVGSQVSMNALATLLLLFIGGQIWGLSGMILFIPIGAIMKIIFDEVESLQPFGYVMGRRADDKSEERSRLAKRVSQLAEKSKKKTDPG